MVIADSVAAAKDGAERVAIDYEPLPAVTQAVAAAAPDAPRLWEEAPLQRADRRRGRRRGGDRGGVCARRACGASSKPGSRASTGGSDGAARGGRRATTRRRRRYTVSCRQRRRGALEDRYRARSSTSRKRQCGWSCATSAAISARRGAIYPEFALVAWAARRVGRPVKWTCERHEAFLSDYQGRDLASEAELALDADGRFLATARVECRQSRRAHRELLDGAEGRRDQCPASTACRRPASARAASLSNTTPTRPYRSSGRPEVMFVMERLIDLGGAPMRASTASRSGGAICSPAAELPYTNPFGMVYDSGDYHEVMDRALGIVRLGMVSARAAPRRESAASFAASASPTTSTPRPAFRASAPRSRCSRTASSTS